MPIQNTQQVDARRSTFNDVKGDMIIHNNNNYIADEAVHVFKIIPLQYCDADVISPGSPEALSGVETIPPSSRLCISVCTTGWLVPVQAC